MEILVYILLFATSIIGLGFIIERARALRWDKVVPPEVESAVESCQSPNDVAMLRRVCEQNRSPLARLLLVAIDHLDQPKADNADAVQTQARHEITQLERGIVVLEIIVGIAPLLGLVGTIVGMMAAFSGLGATGLNDVAKLAGDIGTILKATLFGLLIAIPAVIFWSYFNKKVEVLSVEMERLCEGFVRRQYRDSGDSKKA
ncbi:MAG: MotA/TolQ/ExbB proton channel family protein [Verrucomicrobiota bacterium]|jgi:biopolymer transport protein ExbB